ncbi:MAG: hypothetical protein RsTaC01_0167 [Candidatus Paraimprobicoccus trichonymphae]|uniref:Calpain catalytic domain-containing protein n=1 Tax=Candidatus Paraimprobicoccus trichonymphae TaxID=3033793 RepID=A0AA48I5F9_9FIRM|nr:MAG: hypothetical protein RsTaC01_0167 [Candidatus Paraimprobicoccus trichonymphae]
MKNKKIKRKLYCGLMSLVSSFNIFNYSAKPVVKPVVFSATVMSAVTLGFLYFTHKILSNKHPNMPDANSAYAEKNPIIPSNDRIIDCDEITNITDPISDTSPDYDLTNSNVPEENPIIPSNDRIIDCDEITNITDPISDTSPDYDLTNSSAGNLIIPFNAEITDCGEINGITASNTTRFSSRIFEKPPSKDDIHQVGRGDDLEDCYILSILISILNKNPEFIYNMMKDFGEYVIVRLFSPKIDNFGNIISLKRVYIKVNKIRLNSSKCANWVNVLEIAYAASKLNCLSYKIKYLKSDKKTKEKFGDNIKRVKKYDNKENASISDIHRGFAGTTLAIFTGNICENIENKEGNTLFENKLNLPYSLQENSLFYKLNSSKITTVNFQENNINIVSGHEYALDHTAEEGGIKFIYIADPYQGRAQEGTAGSVSVAIPNLSDFLKMIENNDSVDINKFDINYSKRNLPCPWYEWNENQITRKSSSEKAVFRVELHDFYQVFSEISIGHI